MNKIKRIFKPIQSIPSLRRFGIRKIIVILFFLIIYLSPTFVSQQNQITSNYQNNQNTQHPSKQGEGFNYGNYSYYYKNLTIPAENIKGTEILENFPILVSITDTDFKMHAQESGQDIHFYQNNQTLYFEKEIWDYEYNNTHSRLVAWVNIPQIDPFSDTTFQIRYGNDSNQYSPGDDDIEKVWDENYKGVWHLDNLNELPELFIADSSKSGNNGTPIEEIQPQNFIDGKIENAIQFQKNQPFIYIDCGNDESINLEGEMTAELWVKLNENVPSNIFPSLFQKGDENNQGWRISFAEGRRFKFSYYEEEDGAPNTIISSGNLLKLNTWHQITLSFNSYENYIKLYFDGALDKEINSIVTLPMNDEPLIIGDMFEGGKFDGAIDEIRISNVSRSDAWIETSYENQNNPKNFIQLGEEKFFEYELEIIPPEEDDNIEGSPGNGNNNDHNGDNDENYSDDQDESEENHENSQNMEAILFIILSTLGVVMASAVLYVQKRHNIIGNISNATVSDFPEEFGKIIQKPNLEESISLADELFAQGNFSEANTMYFEIGEQLQNMGKEQDAQCFFAKHAEINNLVHKKEEITRIIENNIIDPNDEDLYLLYEELMNIAEELHDSNSMCKFKEEFKEI